MSTNKKTENRLMVCTAFEPGIRRGISGQLRYRCPVHVTCVN